MTAGTLYLVATPIGNLEDLTYRAHRVLREADVIACEDTRHTRLLLTRYGISTPLVSYHEHNEARRAPELLKRLRGGETVALVSDAGTPALSDPGYALIRQAIAENIPVVAIPGASAITAALTVSGLPPDRFLFLGFLPRKTGERRRILAEVAQWPWTLVIFEAPHRIAATLDELRAVLGDRRVALVRELTKRFEEVVRGTVTEALERLRAAAPRGEFTIVLEGALEQTKSTTDIAARLRDLLNRGTPPKEAVHTVAHAYGIPKRDAYKLMLEIAGKQ